MTRRKLTFILAGTSRPQPSLLLAVGARDLPKGRDRICWEHPVLGSFVSGLGPGSGPFAETTADDPGARMGELGARLHGRSHTPGTLR